MVIERPSICFVAPEAFGALPGQDDGSANGAEFQQAVVSQQLVSRGYRVSFVTEDVGQKDGIELGGIRAFKAYRRSQGMRFVRFAHPRATALWRAMRRSDADIYYQRTCDATTGLVAAFCRHHRRKFIFAVASDVNCRPDLPGRTRHERVLYRYGLRRADRVIAQSLTQQRQLRAHFGVAATVVPSCGPDCGGPAWRDALAARLASRRMLWIGRWTRVKRLEMLLDVAERNADVEFDVIGDVEPGCDSDYKQYLQGRMAGLANVNCLGRVPHADMARFYAAASALICTSRAEGFPNTFVEAWSCGLPTISTFDPDDTIGTRGLGFVAGGSEGLGASIHRLLASPETQARMADIAREHFLQNHSAGAVIPQLEHVLQEVTSSGAGRQRQSSPAVAHV